MTAGDRAELLTILGILSLAIVVPFLVVAAVVIVVVSVARRRSPIPRLAALAWTVLIECLSLFVGWFTFPLLAMTSGAILTWAVARRGYRLDTVDYVLIVLGGLASWFVIGPVFWLVELWRRADRREPIAPPPMLTRSLPLTR